MAIGEPTGFNGFEVRVPFAAAPNEPLLITVLFEASVSCKRNQSSGESAPTSVAYGSVGVAI